MKSLIKEKLKDNRGSLDSPIMAFVVVLIFCYIVFVYFMSQPYFSDKRITEEYIGMGRDLICRQPSKIVAIDTYIKSKLLIIHGKGSFEVHYYVRNPDDDFTTTTDITGSIGGYDFKRGDVLVIYFKRTKLTPFEILIKKDFNMETVKEGMIEADRSKN